MALTYRQRKILRPRLKTTTGCVTCRERRKKCDESRDAMTRRCGACERLDLVCRWNSNNDDESLEPCLKRLRVQGGDDDSNKDMLTSQQVSVVPYSNLQEKDMFDHPAQLKASPTSILFNVLDKQAYQYIYERGTSVLRVSKKVRDNPMNLFTEDFELACSHPSLLYTHVAIGSTRIAQANQDASVAPLVYYLRALKSFREELARTDVVQPTEAACLTAAALRVFAMCQIVEPEARATHLFGFTKLIQFKLQRTPDEWRPGRITLEIYVYIFAVSATFDAIDSLEDKALDYVDTLVDLLNSGPRPCGQDIIGVPPDLICAVYRLSWLRRMDIRLPEWSLQVIDIYNALQHWRPSDASSATADSEAMITATLYHAACSVLALKLLDPEADVTHPSIFRHVEKAVEMVAFHKPGQIPQMAIGWPLLVLGAAAADKVDRVILRAPIQDLQGQCGLVGYSCALEFLEAAWGDGPGSDSYLGLGIFFREDWLRTVHL